MTSKYLGLVAITALAVASVSCNEHTREASGKESGVMPTKVTVAISSPSFAPEQSIPAKHTCDGEDQSPMLQWSGIPAGARTLAIICDDPDAPSGTWVHWVIYGVDATTKGLPEAVEKTGTLPSGARQGRNDFKQIGYNGPCPPAGKPHRYFFKLYALDIDVPPGPGATKEDILRAMEGHVLGQGELMGKYQRKK